MSDILLTATPSIFLEDANGQKKEYKLGRLSTGTVFAFMSILKKIGLQHAVANIVKIYEEAQKSETQAGEDLTIVYLVANLVTDLTEAEEEITKFGASVLGITSDEFKDLPIGFAVLFIQKLFVHPDIKVFMKTVSEMIRVTPMSKAN